MALNHSMLVDSRPVPLPNELTLLSIPAGVEVSLVIPPDASSATASGSGPSQADGTSSSIASASSSAPGAGSTSNRKLKESGALWLTDQRLIFTSKAAPPSLSSLSVPLPSILSTNFHQPILSSNYLSITIKPTAQGGLTEGTMAEIRFSERPMFEFANMLEKTREKAIYMKRQLKEEDETLPMYTTRSTPVPDYNPPSYDSSSSRSTTG